MTMENDDEDDVFGIILAMEAKVSNFGYDMSNIDVIILWLWMKVLRIESLGLGSVEWLEAWLVGWLCVVLGCGLTKVCVGLLYDWCCV